MASVLIVDSVSKIYLFNKKKKVLDKVNFTVEAGQCVCIVGPNGIGKSTLLKIITGLIPQNSGTVRINGKIAYVPEVSINFSNADLKTNMDFYRTMSMNRSPNPEYVDLFKLPKTGKRMKHFSKGMKRKFDLIRALDTGPNLCIMDEPFEGLDPVTCRDMIDLLLEQKEKGLSIIMSSHDMSYVAKLADDVMLLNDGKLKRIEGWKERRVTIFIDMDIDRVKELVRQNNYNITSERGVTRLTVPLKDYSEVRKLVELNKGNVLREENSTLEEIYLEHIEE